MINISIIHIYINYTLISTCRKCEGNIEKSMEQEGKLCNEVETDREYTYLGGRVSAGGGYEADVTAITKCWWFKFRECIELLYGRFPPKLKGGVYNSYVRPAILYGSEAWCLKESDIEVLQRTERSMCGLQLKVEKELSI